MGSRAIGSLISPFPRPFRGPTNLEPLGRTALRPSGRRTPGIAPSIPRGPGGRARLADRRPARLGLVLPRPALGVVPHRPPSQSRCPHPGPGESFDGTLVSDFYAAYNGLECAKQRCLVHLLRELARLREALPLQSVRAFIQP